MFILQSLASHTLLNVLNGRNLSDQLHSTQAQHPELSGAERAALLDLCYGTLRHYGWLQATLARLLKTPLADRFVDTLLGSILSFGAVTVLWPEWQYQRIPELLANATRCNYEYLKSIISALQTSDRDEKFNQKRIAAHHADSALAQAWINMQTDPKQQRRYTSLCAALTYRNHSLSPYVSALGVHQELHGSLFEPQLIKYAESLFAALDEQVTALSGNNNDAPIELASLSASPYSDTAQDADQKAELIRQEMNHIGIMTTEILKLSRLLKPLIQGHSADKSFFRSK